MSETVNIFHCFGYGHLLPCLNLKSYINLLKSVLERCINEITRVYERIRLILIHNCPFCGSVRILTCLFCRALSHGNGLTAIEYVLDPQPASLLTDRRYVTCSIGLTK